MVSRQVDMSLPKFLLFCLITASSRLRAEYAGGPQNQIVERVILVERPLAFLFDEVRRSGAPVEQGVSDNIPPHEKYAEMARYIVHHSEWASIATLSTRGPTAGLPFANVNPNASLVMTLAQSDYCKENHYDPESPLCARVILNGQFSVIPKSSPEWKFSQKALFSRHPEMADWPPDHSFFFAKLNLTFVCVLDYFGGAQEVSVSDYFQVGLAF
ncbi:unnamed protein product [Darwinula stevensoni]|uniref:CREG-like beta-barrel domain-containing protein n=1 Tax=Darwinula stevensoni TaxID=69355 RepID=A0A7R8XC21_9CRUS|nr:unnamed protein product [Darwinula stevensoni]CAG0888392.1 unnamed protein product [Darwinula stevensoni]